MAQQYTTDDGISLKIPGTYVSTSVKAGSSGVVAAGIVTIIGESSNGPAFTEESDLQDIAFTPDQFGKVAQKYGSGHIVDAFKALASAANDPAIVGAVSLVRIIKTNPSVASSAVMNSNGSAYATLKARSEGRDGNLIKYSSSAAAQELAPQTGLMAYTPSFSTAASLNLILNGSVSQSVSIPAKQELDDLVAAIENVANDVLVVGSQELLPVSSNVGATLSASSPSSGVLVLSLNSGQTFSGSPAVGDVVIVSASGDFGASSDSVVSAGASLNVGSYIITAVSNTASSANMTLKKMNSPAGMNLGSASGSILAGQRDVVLYKPLNIKNMSGTNRKSAHGLNGLFNSVVSGPNVTLIAPANWAQKPQVGDIFKLGAAFAGILPGFYSVSASSVNSATMVRLSIGSAGASGSEATVSEISDSNEPFRFSRPVIDGLGKSMELSGSLSSVFKDPSTQSPSAQVNMLLVSGAEYKNSTSVSRGTITDTFTAGGEVAVKVGSSLANASMQVLGDRMDFYSGSSLVFSASYQQFNTLQNMVDYINSQTGFQAQMTSAKYSNLNPSVLDDGTYGLLSNISASPARVKIDAYRWNSAVNGSSLVKVSMSSASGLPEPVSPEKFLSGGAKNGTTSAQAVAAIDACEKLNTNFIVPLFSRDASEDIAEGLTESTSTYSVDAINAYLKSHVLKMSSVKMRRNRMAFVSKLSDYESVKDAAGELVSYRVALAFQKVNAVSASGAITQYQPWMTACIAAGMQAAAGYKGIVKKFANVSGVLAQSDFDASSPGDLEDALTAGLLILERVNTGGVRWVSDQTTYSADNNFVYNSVQAVYLADLITLSLIQTFDRAVVGKSVAEISAAAALSILEAAMFDYLRLRWITPSDDGAPKGFKNASVKLNGGVMSIAVEVKLSGIIYFVPISLSISEVQQSA